MNPHSAPHRTTLIFRWTARILAVLVFLFWGAFFLEHLAWFAHASQLPSAKVFLGQMLHFLLLAGLLIAWKWEIPGSALILAAALLFFSMVAGKNFLLFFGVTALPAVLFIIAAITGRNTRNNNGQLTMDS